MNRIIASALVALATVGTAAGAMTTPTQGQLAEIGRYAPNAELGSLSTLDATALLQIIHGGDSEGEKRQAVQARVE